MPNKALFAPARATAPATNTVNEAGGVAYAFPAEMKLAQFAATGTFSTTYYTSAEDQLKTVLELLPMVSNEFIAKTAVFARERGYMKDMPAALLAYLAKADVKLMGRAFSRVIDSGKMLRNFVQLVRSGQFGRKSFGTAPKRLAREWFAHQDPVAIFRQSLGDKPSMADVIKMIRPDPGKDVQRQALYGYLIGKKDNAGNLPAVIQEFEAFKKGYTTELPNVPFEMLTALELTEANWKKLATRMSWTQLRMNLNTLARHGVLKDAGIVSELAAKLKDPALIQKARVFPYQLMATYTAVKDNDDIPTKLKNALHDAMEVAVQNVPKVEGRIVVCPDVSGSMHSAVTGERKGSTSKARYIDVAALVAAAFLRQNDETKVIPFDDEVHQNNLSGRDSILTNAEKLATFGGGGTACSAPLSHMNEKGIKADLVVFISDNMSWADFGGSQYSPGATRMAAEWLTFKKRNPKAKLVLIDIAPYESTQMPESQDVLNVGGFSDQVFDVVGMFAKGELSAEHWVGEIKKISL